MNMACETPGSPDETLSKGRYMSALNIDVWRADSSKESANDSWNASREQSTCGVCHKAVYKYT